MRTFDVAVIGAGIAGASLAWRLAAERSVALVEREVRPGLHTTGRSAAMFMESYGPPMVRALTRASRAFYEAPPDGFAAVPILAPRGALYLASPGQADDLDALERELDGTCPSLRRLDAGETLSRVPCLRPERVQAALLDDDAHDIDVDALHQGWLRGLRRRGGTLLVEHDLAGAAHDGRTWTLNFTADEPLRATTVVDAAGAWADVIASRLGAAPIGLVPRRRSAFTFRVPDGVDASRWPTVAGVDESWYFKPEAGVLLGSPANADDTVPHDVVAEELDIATGIARIEAVSTLTIRRPLRTWAGLRSFVRDGEMVIGADETCPGFFWLAGQGGYGIQSAHGAALLADALLRGVALPDELVAQGVEPERLAPRRLR